VPISIAVDLFNILTVPAERPWRTAADIIAAAKARPGELSWGHSGIGSAPQLAGLLFAKMAGIETIEVSYRGGGLVATDMISGRLDYGFPTSPSVMTHIESGKLRGLAVPTLQRSRLLPNIPTVAETGLPGFNVPSWYAVVAPRGTPEPAVERLAHAPHTTAHHDRANLWRAQHVMRGQIGVKAGQPLRRTAGQKPHPALAGGNLRRGGHGGSRHLVKLSNLLYN
jgi:tripartite-type tricarboxylate transporter receptor subunit TctC